MKYVEPAIDEIDEEIIREIERSGGATVSWLSRRLKWSKTMIWRRLKRLESLGLLTSERRGGIVVYTIASPPRPGGLLKLGILRASEYPYIIPLRRMLSNTYRVQVLVYDEAFRLASDLARGKVHIAMVPAVTSLLIHRASAGAVVIVGGGSAGGASIIEGPGDEGHVTSMASTMELCAEVNRLPRPRIYASSGTEILEAVASGRVKYGVVWEPYASEALKLGLKVRECNVPVCCLLTVHRGLSGEADKFSRLMADAIAEARRGSVDLQAYANLVGLSEALVKSTVPRYTFLSEPPVKDIKRAWSFIVNAALPPETPETAIYIRGNK